MITVILPIHDIPRTFSVRKPTGQNKYTIKDDISVYDKIEKHKAVILTAEKGTVFLFNENYINCVPDTDRMAIDFNGIDEVRLFLHLVEEMKEERNAQ